MLPFDAQLEAVLFWKGEQVSLKKLAEIFGKEIPEVEAALKELEVKLAGRGLTLVWNDGEVMLATSKAVSELIEKLTKEELIRDLGKAGVETLSIVLYRGPVTRAEIDYIRGVNSNFILRNLLIRGLVEKVSNPKDQRSFLYKPTFELLSYLGVNKIEDLPEFAQVKTEFENYKKTTEKTEAEQSGTETQTS